MLTYIMKMTKLTLILLLTSYSLCDGYKLLLVFPFPSLSHSVLGEGCVRNLLKAGHKVTYITPYPIKIATKGLRQIDVMNNTKIYPGKAVNVTNIITSKTNMEALGPTLDDILEVTKSTVMHVNVQKLINDVEEQFDAVIAEWMFNEVYSGFSSIFNCPLIWSYPGEPHPLALMLLKDHPSTSMLASASNPNSFWLRLKTQFQFLQTKFHKWLRSNIEKSMYNRAFGPATAKRGGVLPSFDVTKYNGSLLLGNSHFSTGQTFRLPLNYIEIAGYHIDEEREPLSKNLQNIMNNAKQGVIYFNLGSTVRADTVPDNIKTGWMDIFKLINRTVIWLYEGKLKAPKNVHLLNRVPQQNILAHPNCALFITSGELLSITEAIYFGVPIIGIPIFGHQFNNIEKAVDNGFAQKVNLLDIKALKTAIDNGLRNTKYRERAKELSSVFRDRPISPDRELVFWIEYIVRRKGAPLLSSPIILPWYDVIYFEFLVVVLITVGCMYGIFVYLVQRKKDNDKRRLSFKKYI